MSETTKNGWKNQFLGDVLQFQRGFDITKKEQILGNIPIVSSSGITSFHNQFKVKGPGVVIGRKGTLGTTHFISDDFWPHDTTLWIKDFKGNHPRFLYYFLQVMHLENYDVGASNPTLNRNHIHKLRLHCPSLPIQRKIAAILSAYDDLIENNNRRIALLENMAEEIYREWFVRLRFPGHEGVKKHKGIPEDWEKKTCNSVLQVLSGGTPKTKIPEFWNGTIPFFTPKDALDSFFSFNTEKYITSKGLQTCNSALYSKNTIFITARGTVGKIVLAGRDMAMNQSCYALVPKADIDPYFYFLALKDSIKYIKGISKSGVFDNIVVDTFKVIEILCPTESLMLDFNQKIQPAFEQIEILMISIKNLKQTRDRLLSRLISGKLSVEDLDIQFPPSMSDAIPSEKSNLDKKLAKP